MSRRTTSAVERARKAFADLRRQDPHRRRHGAVQGSPKATSELRRTRRKPTHPPRVSD